MSYNGGSTGGNAHGGNGGGGGGGAVWGSITGTLADQSDLETALSAGGGGGLFGGLVNKPTLEGSGFATAYNQSGTFSALEVETGILLKDTSSFSSIIEGVLRDYPTEPFTLDTLWSIPVPATDYVGAGIAIADTTTGKAMWLAMIYNGGYGAVAYAFSAPGTFSAGLSGTSFTIGNSQSVWFRIQDDGTNITFSCSYDGVIFTQVATFVKSASYLGSSGFNFIGPTICPQIAPVAAVLQSWTITTP